MQFSVVMSVYRNDKSEFVMRAIESITDLQTIKPDEVIIVVDGPIYGALLTDVKKYETSGGPFKVVWLPENIGHAGARQAGLEASSNNIIAIMDADDIALPYRFEQQIKYISTNPDVSIVGGQITEFVDSKDNTVGKRIVPCSDKDIKSYLKSRCPMNFVTVMFRKDDIQQVGGFIDWFCEEDYYLWIRMAEAGCKFANLPDTLVNVRVGKEMYSRRGGWRYFKSEAKLQGYMLNHRIISLPRYLYNVAGRFAVQIAMPNWLRGFVFQKLFRK